MKCTAFVLDANLYYCQLLGGVVTGIIICFFNGTPVDWLSKKQNTVETATSGSKFIAAKTSTDQIIANRNALRSFGVAVKGATILNGDNCLLINKSTIPTLVSINIMWRCHAIECKRLSVKVSWIAVDWWPQQPSQEQFCGYP
jgi:hypothetical protein